MARFVVGRAVVSVIFEAALDEWRRVRRDYELFLEAQYVAAIDACNGVLLNARGRAAGISSYSLFKGPRVRAAAYASDELVEFWQAHPRVTFERFEQQSYEWADARDGS